MADRTVERLTALRNALLHHHKRLLDAERAVYERDVAPISNPGQYLNLVLNDPWFSWLRELSQFIVLIDETLSSREPVAEGEGERLMAQARSLISPSETGNGFGRGYWDAMQRDPEVVLAHRDVLQSMAAIDA